jgi:hypothetical protein
MELLAAAYALRLDGVTAGIADLFPVPEKDALSACRAEWAGAGEVRLTFATAPNLHCQFGSIAGCEMGSVLHGTHSRRVIRLMESPPAGFSGGGLALDTSGIGGYCAALCSRPSSQVMIRSRSMIRHSACAQSK